MILILYLHCEQCSGDSKHLLVEREGTNGTSNALPFVRGGQDYQYQYGGTMSGEDGGNAGAGASHTMAYNNNPDYKIPIANWVNLGQISFEFKVESFGTGKQAIVVFAKHENVDVSCCDKIDKDIISGIWLGRHHMSQLNLQYKIFNFKEMKDETNQFTMTMTIIDSAGIKIIP